MPSCQHTSGLGGDLRLFVAIQRSVSVFRICYCLLIRCLLISMSRSQLSIIRPIIARDMAFITRHPSPRPDIARAGKRTFASTRRSRFAASEIPLTLYAYGRGLNAKQWAHAGPSNRQQSKLRMTDLSPDLANSCL